MDEMIQQDNIGKIKAVDIENEMRIAYLDYAMSVIVRRALPDARDGLKPVHRRILYAMHDMGLRSNSAYRKSARIVGDVLGKYHPHSDSSVYEAMARMAQDFSLRYMLVDGQGNFGSIDGDNPAAMRYTEARMASITEEMLRDIEKDTVNWQDNFDASLQEPTVLPARIPNMLLNGSNGIAVGMSTNIPPHNLKEICQASIYLIDHWSNMEDVRVQDLMQFVKGPDFPTGAQVIGGEGLVQAYGTGKGAIVMRAVAEIEETENGRNRITITEIPYQVNKASLLVRIADLVRNGRIKDISDLRDETDRNGMAIVVELKRGAQPRRVLNQLYKYTALQSNFGMNILALHDGGPRLMPLKMALRIFVEHRQDVITRRTEFDLNKAKARAHILEGLRIALENLDAVIETIRASQSVDDARQSLIDRFSLSAEQAQAILDMQLRRLAALERQKIDEEYQGILETIAYLEDLLANPDKILSIIREDLEEIAETYGDDRRTAIIHDSAVNFEDEDLIKKEEVLVTITQQGYIKRVPSQTYKVQGRGGRGVTGMTTRDEDDVAFLFAASTHDTILYFSDRGKVYSEKVYRIPDATRIAKGMALVNLINMESGEKVTAAIAVSDFKDAKYLVMATKQARIKRCDLRAFESVRPSGLIALNLGDDDYLSWAKLTSGDDDIIVVSKLGQSIRFHESDVRVVGRTASGVNAIRLLPNDEVAGMDIILPDNDLLIVTKKGMGKRTPLVQYNRQSRYGIGVRTLSKNYSLTGDIIDIQVVEGDEHITLISTNGKMIRISVSQVPRLGRATQGARVMNLKGGDTVASMAVLGGNDLLDMETDDEEAQAKAAENGQVAENVPPLEQVESSEDRQ